MLSWRKRNQKFSKYCFVGRNISSWNREKQKNFLDFCSEMFRLALLQNYDAEI
jgi:DNA polymerase-3 subunit delta'